jgi:hypothetical protein
MSGSSILDGHPLPPIVVPEDKTSQYTLVAVTLIVILVFWIWATHTMASSVATSELYLQCDAGQCPTNFYNGEKRCSSDPAQTMLYDPSYEVCNSPYACENAKTPYALLSDGSTNRSGVCETGDICRCVTKPQCPNHSLVLFEMQNGSAYLTGIAGSRYTFQQTPVGDASKVGNANATYTNANTQFCTLNAYDTNRLSPGACNFTGTPSPADMLACTNRNPCVVGTLAYITNQSPANFNSTLNANYYPLACVPGIPCDPKSYPVWDQAVSQIACVAPQ